MNSSGYVARRQFTMMKDHPLTTEYVPRLRRFLAQLLHNIFRCLSTVSFLWLRKFLPLGFSKYNKRTYMSSPEKVAFEEEYDGQYGYPYGSISIDELRSKEFSRLKGTTYLDHAGTTLYTETQLKSTMNEFSMQLYGNPHSQSDSSMFTSSMVESARHKVLELLKASAEEYTCVFTSGATAALKLVGEAFPWSSDSHYMYTMENHNSVLGIREYALDNGATVTPVDINRSSTNRIGESGATKFELKRRSAQTRHTVESQDKDCRDTEAFNLFAFPQECNFSGAKFDLELIPFVQQAGHVNLQRGRWLVLLDAAKGCSTSPPDLSRFPADFVAISFYKIFGYPTGLGALLIRNDVAKLMKKKYFGGGTVAVSIADTDFVQRRQKVEQWLEDGTTSFLGIAALHHGFRVIDRLQMSAIGRHTGSLASYTASKLAMLRHSNGRIVSVLYGNHDPINKHKVSYWGPQSEQGPIIAFNLKRADGSWIGSREVEKLATLSRIHLRTGCFCNPGACSKYLGLSTREMKANFEAGHVCWDDNDLINGRPTGAVRVSFGYMSTFEDCWTFLQFISKFFVERSPIVSNSLSGCLNTDFSTNHFKTKRVEEPLVTLQSMMVYPIKSCAGFSANVWPLGDCGLLFDREWLIMSTSGEVLTQKKCSAMCSVRTHIDLESGILQVQAPNMRDGLEIPLNDTPPCKLSDGVMLCGDSAGASGCGTDAAEWFTEALGIPCALVRREAKSRVGTKSPSADRDGKTSWEGRKELSFANEGQFLLISQSSVDNLNLRLRSISKTSDQLSTKSVHAKLQVDAQRFRPNLVISGSISYAEDNWQTLLIGDQKFKVSGSCNRCTMVNIDQKSGEQQVLSEPLITLASYRRFKGRINFGILLEQDRSATASQFLSKPTEPRAQHGDGDSFVKRTYGRFLQVGQPVRILEMNSS